MAALLLELLSTMQLEVHPKQIWKVVHQIHNVFFEGAITLTPREVVALPTTGEAETTTDRAVTETLVCVFCEGAREPVVTVHEITGLPRVTGGER